MNTQLLDRETDALNVIEMINSQTLSNKIILLTGISGVGKSGLVEKLSQSELLRDVIVSVRVSKSSIDTIENQQYFNALYKVVVKYAKSKMFDNIPSPMQQGAVNFKNIFRVIKNIIKSQMGINENHLLAEPEEGESIIRKKEYISYLLSTTNIILDIENIQNIDTQSLEILKEIICESKHQTYIFEYTLTRDNDAHYENFYKELKELNTQIYCYKVEKMDFMIAKQLAPKDICMDEEKLRELYDKSEGNLMEIILANDKIFFNSSNIDIKLKSLSKSEKYLLYIIFLNDYPLLYEELATMSVIESPEKIITDFAELKDLIYMLCEKKILLMDKDFIKIRHDSIIDIMQHHIANPILYCAYKTLKDYYNRRIDVLPIAVEHLLSLYLKFSDQELLTLLNRVKQFVLNMKYPDLIIQKLEYFRENLLTKSSQGFRGSYYLTIMLTEICLNKKMAEEAQKNLSLIYDEGNIYHIALQAQILSLKESNEAHDSLAELVDKTPKNSRLRLICEICLLYLKTKLLPTFQTKAYGETLITNSFYQEYTEYAFLLRNFAELCDSTEECNKYYLAALKIFENHKRYHDMASVYISLSMIYAYTGNIELARRHLNNALSLDKRELSLCYILNNNSTLQILENNFSEITEKNLKNALLLSVSRYEKLIVSANLLVYYCLVKDFEKSKKIAENIETSHYQDFKYEELLHIIYQNLYFYYSAFKHDNDKKDFYYKQILSLVNSPNTRESTKEIASGMIHLVKSQYFYTQFPFRVDFLGYWEFTIDNDLSC